MLFLLNILLVMKKHVFIFPPSDYVLQVQVALADKSGNMFDFRGNTSSNRAGAWSRHEFALIFPTTQQSSAFSMSPRTSPIAASGATNVKNVIRFCASVNPPFIS